MSTPRLGFTPSREPAAGWVRRLNAQASTNQSIAKGDAVAFVNGLIVPATAGQDPGQVGYGVVLAVYTTAGRPLTFQNTKIIASGGVGQVDVCWNPDQTYYVQCVTSVGPSNLGKNVTIDVSANNPLTGLSGMSVNIPASASTNDLFKVINLSPFELSGVGGPNNGVEVRWNRHLLHAPTAGQ